MLSLCTLQGADRISVGAEFKFNKVNVSISWWDLGRIKVGLSAWDVLHK